MKTVLTGIKPTGLPHIGNYLGAIKPAIQAAGDGQTKSLFFIANYHSLTSIHKTQDMHAATFEVAATWLASGLNPEKTLIYLQSDVREVFELAWILSCFTPKGFMNRSHAYKAKIQENEQKGEKDIDAGVSMGLFSYPVLMAADILLFSADEVPVGEDQVQHLEFARDIAQKFNKAYGEILKLPKAKIQKATANIPGLDGRKMSKSYNNGIPVFCSATELKKLVAKIKTDSLPPTEPKDPQNSLLMDYFKLFAQPDEVAALEAKSRVGIGWGDVKTQLFEIMDRELSGPRSKYEALMNDKNKVKMILAEGGRRAREMAQPLMLAVRKAVGADLP